MPTKLQVSLVENYTGHKQSVYCLCSDENGGFFSAGSDGYVIHWQKDAGNSGLLFATVSEAVFSIAFLPSMNMVLVGGQSGTLYYLRQGYAPVSAKIHEKGVFDILVVSEDCIYTAGGDGFLICSDWYKRKQKSIQLSHQSIRAIKLVGNQIFVGASDAYIYSLNTDFQILNQWKAHGNSVFTIDHVNEHLVTAGRDAKIKVWTLDGTLTQSIDAHWFTIHKLKSNPSGRFLVSTSMDKTIRIWDVHSFNLLKVIDHVKFEGHKSAVNSCLWLTDDTFVSCSDDTSIKCWKVL